MEPAAFWKCTPWQRDRRSSCFPKASSSSCKITLWAAQLTFYLAFYVAFFLAFYLAFFLAFSHSIWHIFWHPSWGPAVPTGLGRSPVEVQRCPLDSRGPRLRSSSAHWYREVVVEVQRHPLESGAGSWGPPVPTAIRSWRGGEEARRRRRRRRRKARRAILKSNNPHLAGGETLFSPLTHPPPPKQS